MAAPPKAVAGEGRHDGASRVEPDDAPQLVAKSVRSARAMRATSPGASRSICMAWTLAVMSDVGRLRR